MFVLVVYKIACEPERNIFQYNIQSLTEKLSQTLIIKCSIWERAIVIKVLIQRVYSIMRHFNALFAVFA